MRIAKLLLINIALIILVSSCGFHYNAAGGVPSYHGKDKWKYHKSSQTNHSRHNNPSKIKRIFR